MYIDLTIEEISDMANQKQPGISTPINNLVINYFKQYNIRVKTIEVYYRDPLHGEVKVTGPVRLGKGTFWRIYFRSDIDYATAQIVR